MFCKNDNHYGITLSEKFKTVLNKATGELEEVPTNISKHQPENKSMYQTFYVIYDFKKMILKTDKQTLLEHFREKTMYHLL